MMLMMQPQFKTRLRPTRGLTHALSAGGTDRWCRRHRKDDEDGLAQPCIACGFRILDPKDADP